jgi:hypothetical protein
MSGATPENAPGPELTALEQALRGLAPHPGGLDRDTLLFRAGQASVPRRWIWPAATAVSTAAGLVLGVLLAVRPPPPVVERIIHVPVPAPAPAPPPAPESPSEPISVPRSSTPPEETPPHLRMIEHLLRWGLDGLEQPPPAPPSRTPAHPYLSSGEL